MPLDPTYEAFFDASPNSYMVLDRELRYVTANRAYLEVTGSKLDEIRGRLLFEAFPHDPNDPDNRPMRLLRASLARVLETKKRDHIAVIEYRVQRAHGGEPEQRFWSATHTPIVDDAGEVAFILQHTVDITELERLRRADASQEAGVLGRAQQVQATNELLGAEVKDLRRLFEQAPGFVCFLRGPELVFELVNEAYERLVGRKGIVGKTVREALPEIAGQGYFELLDRVYSTGTPYVGRAMQVTVEREGVMEPAFIDFVYQPISDARGKVVGIFVQGYDITEQKKSEAQREKLENERMALLDRTERARAEAERANQLKDEFLATVSHELRTPLTAILGWLHIMKGGKLPAERTARALETIERNARAQAQLVEDLLDVSRIMSGKLQLEVELVEITSVVEAALESVRPASQAKSLEIVVEGGSHSTVLGDATRLQQIVWNLLSNAVKFTPEGGRITVRIDDRRSPIEIVVSDTGKGIDADFLPHVFDRFRQAEGSASRSYGGLGLGLAIVRHLTELHGGTISAASEGRGKGSTFTLRLPASRGKSPFAAHDERPTREPQSLPRLDGLRLLVVDDEEDTRDLLREIFERQGANVSAAASSDEAISAIDRARPDIILCDIGMPGEDGYGFVKRLRARAPDHGGKTPAIALTAFARTEDRTRALLAGFRAHVPKPIDTAELVAVVASLAPAPA